MRHPDMRLLPLGLVVLNLLGFVAFAAETPAETQAAKTARLAWLREARFGMFIHWGIYAQPAGVWKDKPIWGGGEWIQNCGSIPVADYANLATTFNPTGFDAPEWTALAKDAGMRYLVITAKHHDGFAMFKSAASLFNIVDATPFKRDVIKEMADACRSQDVRFGVYYSQSQDWHHPGGTAYPINGRKKPDEHWDPALDGNMDDYLRTVAVPQVKELLSNYGKISVLWFDTPLAMTPTRTAPFVELLRLQPGIVVNNRLGSGFGGDTMTPEQHIPVRGYPGKLFEVCMTMNGTWGFKTTDTQWKSTRQLIRTLSDIVSKGGNLLLNVGPDGQGHIPPASIERLHEVGKWMQTNGAAVYGTEGSPFARPLPWGRATRVDDPALGTTVYLHVWEWPADGRLLLPAVTTLPTGAKLLVGGATVGTELTPAGLRLTLPGTAPDPDASVVAVQFAKPLAIPVPALLGPDAHGVVTFSARDGEPLGTYAGTLQLTGSGDEAYLGAWRDPDWTVEFHFAAPQARKWLVEIEAATTAPTRFKLKGKSELAGTIPATASDTTWTTVPLGTIDLPAGEASLTLIPEKAGWKGLNLRRLILRPAP